MQRREGADNAPLQRDGHWRRQLWGTRARAPLDFQLFNLSDHFRAAQTLSRLHVVELPYPAKTYGTIIIIMKRT